MENSILNIKKMEALGLIHVASLIAGGYLVYIVLNKNVGTPNDHIQTSSTQQSEHADDKTYMTIDELTKLVSVKRNPKTVVKYKFKFYPDIYEISINYGPWIEATKQMMNVLYKYQDNIFLTR
jgi:ABC-type enterochelin transport system substrate-binding protein